MRILFGIAWCIVLFIFTCSFSFWDLIRHFEMNFVFIKHPDFSDLFILTDFQFENNKWVIRKIGHVLGFFILAIILTDYGKIRSGYYISISYAVFTEIIQLYFYRGGRILDMLVDSSGILMAYLMFKLLAAFMKIEQAYKN